MNRIARGRSIRTRLGQEDGQTLVEFALVIPLLLLVLIAIFDFAKAYNYWNDQTSLANVAARYAAVGSFPTTCPPPDPAPTTLAAYVRCQAETTEQKSGSGTTTGVQGTGINVCISIADPPTVGNPVVVVVKSTYNWIPIPKALGVAGDFAASQISGRATMRLEYIPPAGVGSIRTTSGACT